MFRDENLLIVFSKAPVPGQVKTRLIPALGAEGAAALHLSLLAHTVKALHQKKHWNTELWVSSTHSAFDNIVDKNELRSFKQEGNDLGQKMHHAFQCSFTRFKHVVIVGTDCPFLESVDIKQAFSQLAENDDLVLGPASDGGYVLIGLNRPRKSLFENISWGTSDVLRQTLEKANSQNLFYTLLPEKNDIDRPEDLQQLTDWPDLNLEDYALASE